MLIVVLHYSHLHHVIHINSFLVLKIYFQLHTIHNRSSLKHNIQKISQRKQLNKTLDENLKRRNNDFQCVFYLNEFCFCSWANFIIIRFRRDDLPSIRCFCYVRNGYFCDKLISLSSRCSCSLTGMKHRSISCFEVYVSSFYFENELCHKAL